MLHARSGNYDRALELMIREYAENPDRRDGFAQLGWVKYEATDYRGALPLMMRDYKKGRLSPEWQVKLAMALGQLGDFESAEAVVARAYQEDGRLKDGFARIAWLMIVNPIKDLLRADNLMQREMHSGRLSPSWQVNYALLKALQGDWETAEDLFYAAYDLSTHITDGFSRMATWAYTYSCDTEYLRKMIQRDIELKRFSSKGEVVNAGYLYVIGDIYSSYNLIEDLYSNNSFTNIYSSIAIGHHFNENDISRCCEIMEKDYSRNRMTDAFAPTYSIALNLNKNLKKSKNVFTASTFYNKKDILIQIGSPLSPKAIMTPQQLKTAILKQLRFSDFNNYLPANVIRC